ncbi:MAG: hypothetical protein HY927_16860 [Elusimicrobia bacterium]|nr:hypothetical protein [Elusimicrobiota bacterium]
MNEKVRVTLQGISQDLSTATGSYDPVELGEMTPDALLGVLQQAVKLQAPSGGAGDDICAPSLVLDHAGETYSFSVENGQLMDANSGAKLGLFDAVALVTKQRGRSEARAEAARQFKEKKAAGKPQAGDNETAPMVWGSDNPDVKGLTPLRKKDLPPTDRVETGVSTIDTSGRCPQFAMTSWKSSNAKQAPVAALVMGIFIGLLAAAVMGAGQPGPGLLVAAVAGFCFWLRGVLARRAKTEFRVGFDWKCNAIWAKRDSDKLPSWLGNASCITDFSVSESRSQRTVRTASPMGNVRVTESVWWLNVHKNNGSCVPLYSCLTTKAEAEEAVSKARALLGQQE